MFRSRLVPLLFLLAACFPDVPTAPAEPASLAVFEAPPTGTPGWVLDEPLAVKLTDPAGRPVAGATVTWRTDVDGAALERLQFDAVFGGMDQLFEGWGALATSVTDDNGIARKQYLAGWERGIQRVVASVQNQSLSLDVNVTSFSATSVTVGLGHACGLDAAGKLYCWVPSWRDRSEAPTRMPAGMRPVAANTNDRFVLISGDEYTSMCGLTTTATLRCFTRASFDATGAATPVPVATPVSFVYITAGGVWYDKPYLCGLESNGKAWCTGNNEQGQLGDGTTTNRGTFVPVSGDVRFATLTTTEGSTCGTDLAGSAWCWGGSANLLGVADDRTLLVTVPTPVAAGRRFVDVAPMVQGVCGIAQTTNEMLCWGRPVVSRPAAASVLTPIGFTPAIQVRALSGGFFSAGGALLVNGTVVNLGDQYPFDVQFAYDPDAGAGLHGFEKMLTRGSTRMCAAHVSGSTVCSWVYYRGAGVPAPN